MSRETYPLSEETRSVLTDHVKLVATEMSVDPSYLYQILSSVESDPFRKFLRLYIACVRSGLDVSQWDGSLAAVRNGHTTATKTNTQCLVDKIDRNADTIKAIVEALEDGVIDGPEITRIHRAIAREKASLEELEAVLNLTHQTSDIRRWAKRRVGARAA